MSLRWTVRNFDGLTVHELYAVLRLREDIFVVEQQCAYHEIDGQDADALHILGHGTDGALVAYARILPPHADHLRHVGRVVVRASERGQGHASALMRYVLGVLMERFGTRSSALAAQAHLEAFYSQFGYARQGETYTWDGIPHVDMVRTAE